MPEGAPPRAEVLVDTGVFVATADTDEPRHRDCSQLLDRHRGNLCTTAAVVAETAWLLEDRLGPAAEARFVTMAATGTLIVIDLTQRDYKRCRGLIDTYRDLGLVDASLIAAAERLGHTRFATLNHRDFRVVRPAHTAAFELIP